MLLSIQILLDEAHRWGQITCIKFISANGTLSADSLCFGTGCGQFLIYRRTRKSVSTKYYTCQSSKFTFHRPTFLNSLTGVFFRLVTVWRAFHLTPIPNDL